MTEVKPLCPYFGSCGGCSCQNIAHDAQLRNKRDFVIAELQKWGIEVPASIAAFSGLPYSYRNRMDFVFFSGGIGLRRRGRWDSIVAVRKCAISNDRLNLLLSELWKWFDENRETIEVFNPKKKSGTLKYAVIRAAENTDDSAVIFTLNRESPEISRQVELVRAFAESSSAKNVIVSSVEPKPDISIGTDAFAVKGGLHVEEMLLGKKVSFSSLSFFQNNTRMTEKMIEHCRGLLEKYCRDGSVFVDLYGGAGTFGIALADLFDKTVIIDIEESSIIQARRNIEVNSINNAEAVCSDASSIAGLGSSKLFMVVDPPRCGMHPKVLKEVVLLSPEALVYISCNPKQLPQDLNKLLMYYAIKSIAVFDLFPQTSHIETVVELIKKNQNKHLLLDKRPYSEH